MKSITEKLQRLRAQASARARQRLHVLVLSFEKLTKATIIIIFKINAFRKEVLK